MPIQNTPLYRRTKYPLCGRLVVLQTGKVGPYDPLSSIPSSAEIAFPSMPDSVELARSTEYITAASYPMPDGLHQYKGTQPLIIPFSFKLHCMDSEYCPNGALSILQLAGRLHSFSLPISVNADTRINVRVGTGTAGIKPADGTASSVLANAQQPDNLQILSTTGQGDIYPPVTLRLELIYVDSQSPGIMCTGYVKDVRVKLNAPWLRGPNRSNNLPTSADFEFNFVHVPGYGNGTPSRTTQSSFVMAQAFADDVKNKFFNTLALSDDNGQYQGFLTP